MRRGRTHRARAGYPPAIADADAIRRLALALPESSERPCYGTPAFYVRRTRLFARMHQDGESVVVKVDPAEREALVAAEPRTFDVTDHYRAHPLVLVRFARVDEQELRELLTDAWLRAAPARLAEAFRRREVD